MSVSNIRRSILPLLVICAVFLTILFSSCGGEDAVSVSVHLEYDAENGVLVDSASGNRYRWASLSYEPASVGEAYADVQFGEKTVYLYRVGSLSPEIILTEKFEGAGGLLYEESTPLPALEEMQANRIYVCTMTASETICIDIFEEQELIDSMITLLDQGEQTQLPSELSLSFSLKFASDANEGIYYNILYAETGDDAADDHYLYDRGTRKCVRIPDGMFLGILYGELPETETEELTDTEEVTG